MPEKMSMSVNARFAFDPLKKVIAICIGKWLASIDTS
jgi:hypothetical protein